jgi:predicted ATPase/class 3 adenylate cyclase/DNA-binding CsgD family transcriptional regulator
MSATDWSELAVSGLPTGTVTLLLADVEGSTRLWETQPEEMTAAIAALDDALTDLVAVHGGVRPVEQGEGDSFVLAFARASDAVACALALQRAPLAPIRLRIGVNTGEIQLRDEGNYIGPTINRTARLRDLAHGGQTVLSGATEAIVIDHLPDDAWLNDLGSHPLRDLPRPERVVQLCHPGIRNEFPPLRVAKAAVVQRFPTQLTSFVGRVAQINEVRRALSENRLVTLTGAGGAGKTRLAIQIAGVIANEFRDGAWYVDLSPITNPDVVQAVVARALGLPDQPSGSAMDAIVRFVGDRQMLVVLDNCEHLLDVTAELTVELLKVCPALTLLTTSREPIGIAGEVTLRVPSLTIADEAIELFAERARLVRADFHVTDDNVASVTEICRRLDGMPLAIELAAARVRALSLQEIVDSLHDRFRLLTGGSRTTVRRQQTLRASVDWSHALLTEPERMLFRSLAAFLGGFDLEAAQAITGDGDVQRYQVLDLLTLLVDKSLVVADESNGRTRYRLLETVRQYASEKLGESGDAIAVRTRHRDYYTAMAVELDGRARFVGDQTIDQVERDMDNLRAAFTWSREHRDTECSLQLASALHPLWLARGRIQEGLAWLDASLGDLNTLESEVAPAIRVRALADKALLDAWVGAASDPGDIAHALAVARDLDDPVLLARVIAAFGVTLGFDDDATGPSPAEAIDLVRTLGDKWALTQTLAFQAYAANAAGDPIAARAAAEEGRDIADTIGDGFTSRTCRTWLGWALMTAGDLAGAATQLREVLAEAEAVHDVNWRFASLMAQTLLLAYQGDTHGARTAADAAVESACELGGFYPVACSGATGIACLAAGDVGAATEAGESVWEQRGLMPPGMVAAWIYPLSEAALARGDLVSARRWAHEAVSTTTGWHRSVALITRARVAIAEGDLEGAERDAHEGLGCLADVGAHVAVPDVMDCLAILAGRVDSHREAIRLFAAADTVRQRVGQVRFKIYDADCEAWLTALREAMGESDFDAAWAEGAALSTEEAIAYAQRGRGERKRPSSGWASLTPTELDVVRLVAEGLGNKDIAARLFISHRTVQTHLTHVYTKLGMTSRVQLAQEAAKHA